MDLAGPVTGFRNSNCDSISHFVLEIGAICSDLDGKEYKEGENFQRGCSECWCISPPNNARCPLTKTPCGGRPNDHW